MMVNVESLSVSLRDSTFIVALGKHHADEIARYLAIRAAK
jgi:hypothetical protein